MKYFSSSVRKPENRKIGIRKSFSNSYFLFKESSMKIFQIFIWASPLLLPPISFFLTRLKTLRTPRNYLYVIIIFGAFFLNLTGRSFKNDYIDKALYLSVALILLEIFWLLFYDLRQKRKVLFRIFSTIALILFITGFWKWLSVGPTHFERFWITGISGVFQNKSVNYYIKEYDNCSFIHPTRLIALSKSVKWSPLEKKVNSYQTPEGYYNTPFDYKWSKTYQGIRVDIKDKSDTLWTLGEGF
jgi:hypothetical protein